MVSPLAPDNITVDDISYLFGNSVHVAVLRLDKLHPQISGNKWFKLRYYLEDAKRLQKKNIVTFGGAWSNHLLATAAACQLNGLGSTGIIRGEEPAELSFTLEQVKKMGMKLVFVPREEYKTKQVPEEWLSADDYLVPEGGYGELGAKGAATMLDHAGGDHTHVCCAVGTGTMMAGLVKGCWSEDQLRRQVIGVSVMKNNYDLERTVGALAGERNWQLLHDFHFGGYAKHEPGLLAFMNDFYRQTQIPSDFVYTGKLFYAVSYLIREDFFPKESKILVVHSGGLQGNLSLRKGTLIF